MSEGWIQVIITRWRCCPGSRNWKSWGVIESNQMKIIFYCDALPKSVSTILECISRIISKSNAILILFQNTVLGKPGRKYCVYFLVPVLQEGYWGTFMNWERKLTITIQVPKNMPSMPYNKTLKYSVGKKKREWRD